MFALTAGTTVVPVVTTAQLSVITDTVMANANVLIPVGIGLMALMIGIAIIPRVIYKFF